MAVVRFGPVITSASGSIGSLTFARNAGSSIVRHRPVPPNPKSASQQTTRAAYSRAARAWSDLTDSQRQTWINLAAQNAASPFLHSASLQNPFLLFMRINLRLLLRAGTILTNISPTTTPIEPFQTSLEVYPSGPVIAIGQESLPPQFYEFTAQAQRLYNTSGSLPPARLKTVRRFNSIRTAWTVSATNSPELAAVTVNEKVRWQITQWTSYSVNTSIVTGVATVPNESATYLANGNFQLGTLGADPTSWYHDVGGTFHRTTGTSWLDDSSARFVHVPSGVWLNVYTTGLAPITNGSTYRLRFAAYCVKGLIKNITLVGGGPAQQNFCTDIGTADGTWHRYSYDLVAVGARASWYLYLQTSNAQDTDIYVDNFDLRKVL